MKKRKCLISNSRVLVSLLILSSILLASCSSEEAYTEYERTTASFYDNVGGNISPAQWWKTSVTVKVDIKTEQPVQIWVMSGDDKGTLYDYRLVNASSAISMSVPQGKGMTVYLVSVCNREKTVTPVTLSGKSEEFVVLDFISNTPSQARTFEDLISMQKSNRVVIPMKAEPDRSSLWGSSIAGNAHYLELSGEQLNEAISLFNTYYHEYVPAKQMGLNCDYELEARGNFEITWLAGNCLSSTPHTLGYYYHSPGTYDDITYVDLSETEIYDYIDGLAKVQYKVDEVAANQYGIEANKWYDANFDMNDGFNSTKPNLPARAGDDAYNSLDVFMRYGRHISGIRGISFDIKVPVGKRVGFYVRSENIPLPEQYDRFAKLGIKPYTNRENYKAMNFSCEQMNVKMNGTYRSTIVEYDHIYWLGMENDFTGGDLDCNDVIFGVSSELDVYKPGIVEPDLAPFGEYDDKMPWTIAYEDVNRKADFDFNDAVIKIMPDYETEKCCVTVMAAGSDARMYLHYDGPDGDQNLGEIHELLGYKDNNNIINTREAVPSTSFVEIDCVPWPSGYTVADDAKRFYIEIQRGSCNDCTDVITLPTEPGLMPEALLVAGEWKWPLEGTSIHNAYPQFINWAHDATRTTYWNWYAEPTNDTCVSY